MREFMDFLHEFMEVGELEGDEQGKGVWLFQLYWLFRKDDCFLVLPFPWFMSTTTLIGNSYFRTTQFVQAFEIFSPKMAGKGHDIVNENESGMGRKRQKRVKNFTFSLVNFMHRTLTARR